MQTIMENWFLFIIGIAAICVVIYAIEAFLQRPTTEQISKVKEWLLYAVTEAERELGSGTGKVKLRYVYDMFIVKFPFLVKAISFESFSLLVDEVLDNFRKLLESNEAIKKYVNKEEK